MKTAMHLITSREDQSFVATEFSKFKTDQAILGHDEFQQLRLELRTLREELNDCKREIQRQTVLLANSKVREYELRASLCRP